MITKNGFSFQISSSPSFFFPPAPAAAAAAAADPVTPQKENLERNGVNCDMLRVQ